MLAEGNSSSVELLGDYVVVRRDGNITAEVPVSDVSDVKLRLPHAFSDGYLQIEAHRTVINGMDGTAFFKGKSELVFESLRNIILSRISNGYETRSETQKAAKRPSCIKIMLSSGAWVQIDKVRLYNAGKIAEIQRLRSQAAKSLGGTGALGVFGAPGLAFAAEAVAVSVISAILTGASQKQAADSLVEAQIKYERLIAAGGTDMPVSNIENIEIAAPGLWKARANGSDWLHSGDEFVNIVTPQAPFSVRWADVSLFHPQWPDAT